MMTLVAPVVVLGCLASTVAPTTIEPRPSAALVMSSVNQDASESPQASAQDASPPPDQGAAQQTTPDPHEPDSPRAKAPPTPAHTGVHALFDGLIGDFKRLPSRENLYIAAGGGGLALAVHPVDQDVNVRLRSHYTLVNNTFSVGKYVGGTPVQIAGSLATYAYGRFFDEPKVSHVGMDLLRAQAISEVLVQTLKYATQRRRPDGSDSLSFPSGHAAVTFASATVIERHLGWRKAILGYAIASYVAASRLHDNVHYLSDVVFGAAVGTIAGRTVTSHGRSVWTLTPSASADQAGIYLVRQ